MNHTILNPLPNVHNQTSHLSGTSNCTFPSDNANLEDSIKDPVPKAEIEDNISIEEIKQRIKEMPIKHLEMLFSHNM
jgi:hypothetical protein